MIRKKPLLDIRRDGNTAHLSFPNWEDEEVYIYRASAFQHQFNLHATVSAEGYQDDSLETGVHYKYYIRMSDLSSSIKIVGDHSDQVPPYFEIQAIGASSLEVGSYTISPSWGDTVLIETVIITNLSEGASSIGKYTA